MPVAARAGTTLKFNNAAAHRHKGVYERDPLNFYVEEEGCTHALLDRVQFFGSIIDPCAGRGNIINVVLLRGAGGGSVLSNDIVRRRAAQSMCFDFSNYFEAKRQIKSCDNIISNPPYGKGIILPIVRNMLAIARHKVAILVQAPFLYSIERYELFQDHRPSLILHLSSRPSMPPGKLLEEGIIKAVGGKEDYCWIVFERGAPAFTLTDWILLPKAKAKREQKQARAAAAARAD